MNQSASVWKWITLFVFRLLMLLSGTTPLIVMAQSALIGPEAGDPPSTNEVDHATIVRSWNAESLARGEKLYNGICITCHGNLTQAGSLPTSRPFWKEPFKNGNDPLSLYKTLSQGFGQMPAWTFLTPEQRYDAIHYLRETFVKPHRMIALGKSARIGSARISTSIAEAISRPAVLNARRTPPAQAGSPVDRPGRIAASGLAAAASRRGST